MKVFYAVAFLAFVALVSADEDKEAKLKKLKEQIKECDFDEDKGLKLLTEADCTNDDTVTLMRCLAEKNGSIDADGKCTKSPEAIEMYNKASDDQKKKIDACEKKVCNKE